MVRLTDRPDMTLDVYRGRKTTTQQQQILPTLSMLISATYIVAVCGSFVSNGKRSEFIESKTYMKMLRN